MTAEQFAYWMQGFAELTGDTPPTPEQWKSMREHLATVFNKVTPPVALPAIPVWPAMPHDNSAKQRNWPPCTVECSARPVGMSDGCGTVAA